MGGNRGIGLDGMEAAEPVAPVQPLQMALIVTATAPPQTAEHNPLARTGHGGANTTQFYVSVVLRHSTMWCRTTPFSA